MLRARLEKDSVAQQVQDNRRSSGETYTRTRKESMPVVPSSEQNSSRRNIPSRQGRQRAPTITIDTSRVSEEPPANPNLTRVGFLVIPGLRPRTAPPNDALPLPTPQEPNTPPASEEEAQRRPVKKFWKRVQPKESGRNSDRPPNDESVQTRRKRFIRRFRDDSEQSDGSGRLPRHKPFTLASQMRALLGSWIRCLRAYWNNYQLRPCLSLSQTFLVSFPWLKSRALILRR
jgi:hypothetical protein